MDDVYNNSCQSKQTLSTDFIPSKSKSVFINEVENSTNISLSQAVSVGNNNNFSTIGTDNDFTLLLPKKRRNTE